MKWNPLLIRSTRNRKRGLNSSSTSTIIYHQTKKNRGGVHNTCKCDFIQTIFSSRTFPVKHHRFASSHLGDRAIAFPVPSDKKLASLTTSSTGGEPAGSGRGPGPCGNCCGKHDTLSWETQEKDKSEVEAEPFVSWRKKCPGSGRLYSQRCEMPWSAVCSSDLYHAASYWTTLSLLFLPF